MWVCSCSMITGEYPSSGCSLKSRSGGSAYTVVSQDGTSLEIGSLDVAPTYHWSSQWLKFIQVLWIYSGVKESRFLPADFIMVTFKNIYKLQE